jgi:hypothetical protein
VVYDSKIIMDYIRVYEDEIISTGDAWDLSNKYDTLQHLRVLGEGGDGLSSWGSNSWLPYTSVLVF